MDDNRRHLCRFDHLKHDEGNTALLATIEQHLVSSHSVKRFFDRFPLNAHPMATLSSMVTALSAFNPEISHNDNESINETMIKML